MSNFLVGVDLGQVRDPTAVAVVEVAAGGLLVRHLERIALKTAYADVVERVRQVTRSKALDGQCQVVADATGVGRPVVEMLGAAKLGGALLPVMVTSGEKTSRDGEYYRVPKRDLILGLLSLLREGKVQLAQGLREGKALAREFGQMKARMGAAGERYAAWRHGEHDDLVFAVALACWGARQGQ